jgi:hypothetical protein
MTMANGNIPWFLWPLATLLRFLAFLIGLVGRMAALVLGFLFMIAGGVMSFYIVPLWWLGLLMVALGFLLLVRSMW